MSKPMSYHEQIWYGALQSAEQDVMRATATPSGGRKTNETLEQYVARTRAIQDAAMERVRIARIELKRARKP